MRISFLSIFVLCLFIPAFCSAKENKGYLVISPCSDLNYFNASVKFIDFEGNETDKTLLVDFLSVSPEVYYMKPFNEKFDGGFGIQQELINIYSSSDVGNPLPFVSNTYINLMGVAYPIEDTYPLSFLESFYLKGTICPVGLSSFPAENLVCPFSGIEALIGYRFDLPGRAGLIKLAFGYGFNIYYTAGLPNDKVISQPLVFEHNPHGELSYGFSF